MRQPKKLTSKDIFNNAQSSYVGGVDNLSKQTNLPKSSVDIFDNASKAEITDYKGEYSPAPVIGGSQAQRVDFGEEGFNQRLGAGMRAELNPQDAYYDNQGGIETAMKFVGHAASGAVMKAVGGIAALGSLVAESSMKPINSLLGGALEKIGYDGTFDWDDTTENPLVKGLSDAENYLNENVFKVYTPSNWNDKSFFEQVTDGAWWGNEGADGVAFALSNFIPGAALGKLGLGGKLMAGLADLGEMNAFTKAMTLGRAGLLRGANVAEKADRAITTAFMTASESIFEAKDTGETFTNNYLQDYNARRGTNFTNVEELAQADPNSAEDLKSKKGDAMKHTFFANMAALSASNWIEAGLLNKMMGRGTRGVVAAEIDAGENFLDPIARVQRKGLDKFFNNTRVGYTGKVIAEQMVTEGLYEENVQHAIQNVSQNLALNGKIDNMNFLEEVFKESINNLGDKEAWKSIGAGMVIGGMFGGVGATGVPMLSKGSFTEKEEAIKEGVTKLNEVSNNLRNVGQIYKQDGTIDSPKLQNYIANLVQAKNIQAIHDHYKGKGENELAEIVKNEHVANYVKGFMEVGLKDELLLKVKDLQKTTSEDLTKFGFNPANFEFDDSKVLSHEETIQQKYKELERKVTNYANHYDYLSKVIPSNERARQGEALSWYARYEHLNDLHTKLSKDASYDSFDIATGGENAIVEINSLAREHANKLAELPNQEKFSLPKRSIQTRQELLLLEKEIVRMKTERAEELERAGIEITEGAEILKGDETPKAKELELIKRTLTQVNNARQDAKDNYDALVDKEGGRAFYENLANKVKELDVENIASEENALNEGDYIDVVDSKGATKSGFVSRNEAGALTFGNTAIGENFTKENKVTKATEEQIEQLKKDSVENFRKKGLELRIETVLKEIASLTERTKKGEELVLKQLIEKEDFILNVQNGTVRVSERQFAKQLKQIERTLTDYEDALEILDDAREKYQNRLTELQYLYDTLETMEDVLEEIIRTEADIEEVEKKIAEKSPIVKRLQSIYFSMLNLWKSLFPSKVYKSLEDRALEIQNAIERGVDPATFEEEAVGIANKLSDYTDYKQDLQLTGAEMRIAQRELDELETIRTALYGEVEELNNRLAEYQLQANKLNYTKPLRPEAGQKEAKGNPVAKSKSNEKSPFNTPKTRDISKAFFATRGSHTKGDGLTTDETQLRWFKFTENLIVKDGNYRLRTVSSTDPIYGIGKEQDIYKGDPKEYQNENHYKVVVVDKEGNPIISDGQLVFTSLTDPNNVELKNHSNTTKLSDDRIEGLKEEYVNFLSKAKETPQFLTITGKSNGTARKGEPISIKKAFGTEEVELKVIIDSTVVGEKEFPLFEGMVYAVHNDRPVGLILRGLNSNEREQAIERLKDYSKVRGGKVADAQGRTPQSILDQITSTFFLGERKENKALSIFFLKGEDKLAFGDNLISHEELQSGKYDVQLDQFLSDINHHVKNSKLGKKEEFRDISGKKWTNYNEYLISEREDAPLMSDLRPYSEDIREPQFVNTYLEFSDGKKKEVAKPSKGKGKNKGFAANLPTTVISGSVIDYGNQGVENKIKEVEDVDNIDVVPDYLGSFGALNNLDDLSFPSVESMMDDEAPAVKEDKVITSNGQKIKASEVADIKNQPFDAMDILGEDVFASTKSDPIEFGSDDLFDIASVADYEEEIEGHIEIFNERENYDSESEEDRKQYTYTDDKGNKLTEPFKDWSAIDDRGNILKWFDTEEEAAQYRDKYNEQVTKEFYENNPEDTKYLESYEREKAWFEKNVSSTLSYKRARGLIAGSNWGVFSHAGSILISDQAIPGTGYHEAFHAIETLYLTVEEQQALIDEWRKQNEGLIPSIREGHKRRYEGLSDNRLISEQLADEFAEFMLTNESPYKSWFQKIVDFIKGILSIDAKPKLKSELFDKIKKGRFKEQEPIFRPYAKDGVSNSVAKDLGATAKKQIMDGLTVILFGNLYKAGFDVNSIKDYNAGILGKEKAEQFKKLYVDSYKIMLNDIKAVKDNQFSSKFTKKQFVEMLSKNEMVNAIVKMHVETLKQFGIQFNLEDETDLSTLPEDEKGRDTLGIVDSIEFSTKNGMPNGVKVLIASLPQIENGKIKRSDIGLPIPTDYRRNVSILHNELAGVADFQEQLNIIQNLATRIPEMGYLVKKLSTGEATTDESFFLQSQFRQQFDKNRYTFYMQLFDGERTRIIDANSSRLIDLIEAKWRGSVRKGKSVVSRGGELMLNEKHFEQYLTLGDNVREKVLSFYKDLGITFSSPEKVSIDKLASLMGGKTTGILGHILEGEQSSDIFDNEDINGFLNDVMEQEVKTSLDYSDNQHISPAGKTVYNISLNDYNSIVINEMNRKGLPSHLQWNEATQTGNPSMRNSVWGTKVKNGKKIQTIILEGGRVNEVGETGKLISEMNRGEAALFQFSSVMKGLFPFLRAGDKGLEKGFSFGENISNYTIQEANEIMRGYLADEMLSSYMLNREDIGADIASYGYEKEVGDGKGLGRKLRTFEGALTPADQKDADKLMNNKGNRAATIGLIDKFVQRPSVIKALDTYLETKTQDNVDELINNQIVVKDENGYISLGIPVEILSQYGVEDGVLSKGTLTNIVSQFTYQSLISNIEQTKMFTGDTAFFKDFFKRTSGLVGTGKTAWVGAYVDKMLNRLFARPDKKSDSILSTWIFNDVNSASEVYNDFLQAYKEVGYTDKEARLILDSYLKNNEADAQGLITLPEYREFNLRMGDWNNEREEVYNKAMREEVLSKDDVQMLNAEKPQMFAPQSYEELYAPTFYKMSVLPLIPSMIKGRTLEKVNIAMLKEGVGMALFQSGNKVGARNVRPFYNTKGEFNTDNPEVSHTIDYKYMKKQLDINPIGKDKVIFGTQFRKLVLSGLATLGKTLTIKGKPRNGESLIKEYNDLIDKQVQLETDALIEKLGIEKTGKDSYVIKNAQALRKILKEESTKRSNPDNMIESFDSIFKDGDVKYVELSVNRNKIEQLLMSLVNNNIINQKVFGGALVQAASTGFETKARKQSDVSKESWASNLETLKFYQPTDGSTTAMEVYLPFKFKELLSSSDIGTIDQRLRELIAFRIPTQGLNSIEAIRVKGFLPREAGDIVIVPTEGVTKSGWDFDVDKLNIFYPAYTFNKFTRKPEYIEYDEANPTKQGVQNRLIELARQIVLAKENFVPLTTPNTTVDLKNLETEIAALNPALAGDEKQRNRFVDWTYNLGIRQAYLTGKKGVGPAALQNVNHVMAQIAKLKMKIDRPVYLKHHGEATVVGEDTNLTVDLSQEKDVNKSRTTIQDVISQTLNGFVDIAADPFLTTLNITPETSNVFFFLNRIGVPLRDNVLFLNQPIIRDYINELGNRKALYKEDEESVEKVGEAILSKWQGGEDIDTDEADSYRKQLEKLDSYIKDGGKDKGIQRQILKDYIAYKANGDKLSDLIKAVNFDTTRTASIEGSRTKIENFIDLKAEDVFINLDEMLSQTFLGSFATATRTSINMYKDLFITERTDAGMPIRQMLNSIKNEIKNVRGLDTDKFMNTVKNDIISFLLQNSKPNPSVSTKLGNYINPLFIDKTTNLPTKIALIQEIVPELKDNHFLREIVPVLSRTTRKSGVDTTDVNNLKMFTKRLVKEEQDLITDGWRELFDSPRADVQDLASDLMVFALLQSGLNNSSVSFTEFIPQERYFNIAASLINNVIGDKISIKDFKEKFYKNNYKSNDIVPKDKYGKFQEDNTLVSGMNRPFVKKWNRKTKTFDLFQNTYENQGNKFIFEQVDKLGDGFNFKEYANTVSVLSSNVAGDKGIDIMLEEKFPKAKTTPNKMIELVKERGFNAKTEREYIRRLSVKNVKREEVRDILKELC